MDISEKDFFEAMKYQDLNILKELYLERNKKSLQFTNKEGQTLLHIASQNKNEKTLPLIQFLLECGIDPQSVDENFETPLDIARKNNNVPAYTLMRHHINMKLNELQALMYQ